VFYFNYESPVCYPQQNGDETQTISGSTIISTCNKLDFCLVKLSSKPPEEYNVFYSGWDATPDAPQNGVCIHHPLGDIKKISLYKSPPVTGDFIYQWDFDDNTHWFIEKWTRGITQGGSSGSPLYNQDNRIVGDLTGGSVVGNCTSSDAYFAKFSESWNRYSELRCQLKTWLDPDNTGVTSMDGIDASMAIGLFEGEEELFRLYPNPVDGIMYIDYPGTININAVQIYDLSGRLIKSRSVNGSQDRLSVDVSDLSSGIYLVEIKDFVRSVTKKITVK
jgi:hypothetical protein